MCYIWGWYVTWISRTQCVIYTSRTHDFYHSRHMRMTRHLNFTSSMRHLNFTNSRSPLTQRDIWERPVIWISRTQCVIEISRTLWVFPLPHSARYMRMTWHLKSTNWLRHSLQYHELYESSHRLTQRDLHTNAKSHLNIKKCNKSSKCHELQWGL